MGVCISLPPALCLAPTPDSGPQTWPPICIYRPWHQFVFASPGPKFVFTGPSLQFYHQSGA